MAALILRKLYRVTGIIFPIVYYFFTKSLALTPARQAPRLGLGESECVQSNFEEE